MVWELEGPFPILNIPLILSMVAKILLSALFYFFIYFSTLRYKVSVFLYIFAA